MRLNHQPAHVLQTCFMEELRCAMSFSHVGVSENHGHPNASSLSHQTCICLLGIAHFQSGHFFLGGWVRGLHYASSVGMCRRILEHPNFHSVNLQDNTGQTALHRASSPGVCAEILKDPSFASLHCCWAWKQWAFVGDQYTNRPIPF